MIVSTYGREGAVGGVKELGEAVESLERAIHHHELLLQQAIQALCETRPLDDTVITNLKEQLENITGKKSSDSQNYRYPEIMTPQVIITSKSDIAIESQGNIHLASKDTLCATSLSDMSLASMQNYNLTAAKSIKMFSHQEDIKLYTNQGNIDLQAQNDTMTLTAKKDIEIVSTEQTIDIVASKQIRLRCEGSQITMDKNGITLITDGTFKVKANQHDLQQGQTVGVDLKGLPIVELFNEKFQILSPTGKPMAFVDYQLSSDNHTFTSSTQSDGQTKEVHTPQEKEVSLEIVWMALEKTTEEDETQVQNTTKGDNDA